MAVHFVYRSHYEGPSGKRVVHFDDATVLDWFRTRWHHVLSHQSSVLGDVYRFDDLFVLATEPGWGVPRTMDELIDSADQAWQMNEVEYGPHHLQVLTQDDQIELAFFFFDDEYLAANPGRADYLCADGWRLPDGCGEAGFVTQLSTTLIESGRFFAPGTTYLVFLGHWDSSELTGLAGGYRIEGVRLPELTQYLATEPLRDWPFELLLLRSQLLADEDAPTAEERAFLAELRERPGEEAGWQMYADWLAERGEPVPGTRLLGRALERVGRLPVRDLEGLANRPGFYAAGISEARRELEEFVFTRTRHRTPGVPSLSVSIATDHLAQLCAHVDRWGHPTPNRDLFHQWYLFDDLWAAAHPALATGLLRYARRWDVLTIEDLETGTTQPRTP